MRCRESWGHRDRAALACMGTPGLQAGAGQAGWDPRWKPSLPSHVPAPHPASHPPSWDCQTPQHTPEEKNSPGPSLRSKRPNSKVGMASDGPAKERFDGCFEPSQSLGTVSEVNIALGQPPCCARTCGLLGVGGLSRRSHGAVSTLGR